MTKYALFSYTVQDKFGTKTQMVVPAMLTDADDLTAVAGEWLSLGSDLDAITDGLIIGGRVTMELKPADAWKDVPGDNSFVERSAIFNFRNATSKYKFGIKVPSISDAVLALGKIDLSNADIASFVDRLTTAMASSDGSWVNTALYALTTLADVFLSVRKYRRQLDRSSFEPGS